MNFAAHQTLDTKVKYAPRYFRPAEVETLLVDPVLAKTDLGWVPQITLNEMVSSDLEVTKRHALLRTHNYSVNVSVE